MNTVCFDIDSVLADFIGSFLPLANVALGDSLSYSDITLARPDSFHMDEEQHELLLHVASVCGMYSRLQPVDGALTSFAEITKTSKAKLITARPQRVYKATLQWLEKHGFVYDDIIFVDVLFEKWEFVPENSCIIEDNVGVALSCAEHGRRVILMDQPWNRILHNTDLITRADNWEHVVEIYKSL